MRPKHPPHAARPPHGPAAEALCRRVAAGLPPALVALWAAQGDGVLLVDAGQAPRYEPGPVLWRQVQATGALWLPPGCEDEALWQTVGAWLDHLGGSLGLGAGRLSGSAGATPSLQAAATRLAEILALGYATAHLGTDEAASLLARAVAAQRLRPQPLSAADPLLARWLRTTLLDEGFWRQVARELQIAD